jgi:hypothetical protein
MQQQLTKHGSGVSPSTVLSQSHTLLWMKDAVEVQVASETALQEVAHGGFQKYFKQLYECWQKYVTVEDSILRTAVSEGFLMLPDLRYGSCSRNF